MEQKEKKNKEEESFEDYIDSDFDFSFLDNEKPKRLEEISNQDYNIEKDFDIEITDDGIIAEIFPDIEVDIVEAEAGTCECGYLSVAKRYSKAFNKWIYPILCKGCNKPLESRIQKREIVYVRSDNGKILN